MAEKSDKDDKLVREAQERFSRCQDAESEFRQLFLEDLRFANGDSDNGWQWPSDVRSARELEKRPCLTVNKTKQHNRQISNEARQNKPAVRVSPVDGGADKKTAEIFNGIIRHIEANSSADTAYDTAAEFAVDAGIGYWRVVTDYASDESFEQEIYIRRVKNPLNVYLDPNIQEADGSDAKFGFVFENITKEEFEARYPGYDAIGWPMEGQGDDWMSHDKIRLAEYFYATEKEDTLIADERGNTILMSNVREEDRAQIEAMPKQRTRKVRRRSVRWCLIAGTQIIESEDWPGKYIPIVRVVGDEIDIDGKTERKGHTRALKDPARMYNYWTSSATEFVALQGKAPWVGPAEAREGYENYWDTANTKNHSYLPYNHVSDDGQTPIPAPQRAQPPVMAAAYIQGMQTASEELKMASGQYDASLGARSNETSGRAINARQRQSNTATFHFVDNLARAIKYTGTILVDLIPKIYDTPRVVRILGEDGAEDTAELDPSLPQAVAEHKDETGEIQRIYNPGVGRYDVTVGVGPSYSSRRQEAFDAMTQMAQGNPQLMQQAGDLIMRAADFPMAEELAERLTKFLPPGITDNKIPPEVAQMQQQLQQMQGQLQAADQHIQKLADDRDIKLQELTVDRYKAETERLKLIYPSMPAPLANELAAEFGLQAVASPDIYTGQMMEQGAPPPMQDQQQQMQPPSGGFSLAEPGQQEQ